MTKPFFRREGSLLRAAVQWRIVEKGDAEYPVIFKELKPPPVRVWVVGANLAELPIRIAIVGTRRPNGYGLRVARDLSADLTQQGACIVSGMARGIDAEAHRGALEAGGPTVAVLGSGVDVCQPEGNADLYRAIVERGAIVSEHEPGTPGHARHFPERNRIIAGLSAAVIVAQSPALSARGNKSGAIITADRALELGIAVLAVPGQVGWSVSTGVHELIRGGATLCTGPGDVAQALAGRLHWTPDVEERPIPPGLPAEQRRVLEFLSAGAATRESICAAAGIDPTVALRAASLLEMAGYVGPAPGGRLRRIR